MFDPKTEKFLEWRMLMAWTLPRDTMPDKTGQVWAAGLTAVMMTCILLTIGNCVTDNSRRIGVCNTIT